MEDIDKRTFKSTECIYQFILNLFQNNFQGRASPVNRDLTVLCLVKINLGQIIEHISILCILSSAYSMEGFHNSQRKSKEKNILKY